jgi:N-acetylneuraminic acid mutarotase
MPLKKGGLASVVVNRTIYVFGGEQPEWTFNNNEKFDTLSNKWTSEKSMPTARHGLVIASFDNKIYVIGGGPHPSESGSNINEVMYVGDSGR